MRYCRWVLLLIAIASFLAVTPLPAKGQPEVSGFYGAVTLDGASVADGTVVKAWIDGTVVAQTTTAGSKYSLKIDSTGKVYDGKTVSFTVGANDARTAESATFARGAAESLNLTAASATPPICGFYGSVTIDGAGAASGTIVSAWIDNVQVASTATTGSTYSLKVTGNYAGKTISFRVGSDPAAETSLWEGGANKAVNLTMTTVRPCGFYGSVAVDGAAVQDGTVVSAFIDGIKVASASTAGSSYTLKVVGNYPNKTVSFAIGSNGVAQTSIWETLANKKVDLTVSHGPPVCGFYGSATLNGTPVADGTIISAWIDNFQVASTVAIGSRYTLTVTGSYAGETVYFKAGSTEAAETSTWERGTDKNINLSAVTAGLPSVDVSLHPSVQTVKRGEVLSVEIAIDPNRHGVSGVDLTVQADEALEIVGIRYGDLLGANHLEAANEIAPSHDNIRYSVARRGTTPVPTDSGIVATLSIRVKDSATAGDHSLSMAAIQVADGDFKDISVAGVAPATITVAEGIAGDIDGDGIVGLTDFTILASAYGTRAGETGFRSDADLNGDNMIDVLDLAIVAGNWGKRG